jgi:hypothetical protein
MLPGSTPAWGPADLNSGYKGGAAHGLFESLAVPGGDDNYRMKNTIFIAMLVVAGGSFGDTLSSVV